MNAEGVAVVPRSGTLPPHAEASGMSTRPWGLPAREQAAVVRQLRFRHFKWDAYTSGVCRVLPESIVLARPTHEMLVGVAESFHAALGRIEARLRTNREALRRLGIAPALDPIIAEEEHSTLQLARYDFFPTEDGRWMVSEFNEDAPGGFNEAAGLPALLGNPGDGLCWAGDLRAALLEVLRGYDSIALFYATAYAEDLQHMLLLERWLGEAGHRTVLASPAHLRRGLRRPRVLGRPIDAAVRFFPGEWMHRLPNIRTWQRVALHLPMLNPLHRLIRQSKMIFALWHEAGGLDPADLTLLERHAPATEPFDAGSIPRFVAERERLVLKGVFGRMGDSVVIGALVSESQWSEALAAAARSAEAFCVQERFRVRPLASGAGLLYPAIGIYLVNGRFAGYYSRAAAQPLITHEAFHVATVVARP
jgi:glutathionylspermidine synthase